ncbi:disease resistance protein RGA4-like [Hordeum vulgare subsp. vulgare]|uniref:disease resistance protein RGA4-like n=1 Tax=Hordeum vulgare subsp. vulgare TaxID=112509 RepID=UPI000B46272E|nr:disease resistance protein RGA4-like [Hordeum vulgare subsp. vulgare]
MEFIGVGLSMLFNSILPHLAKKMKESKLNKIAIHSDIDDFRREADLLESKLEDAYSRHEGAHKAKLLETNGNLKNLCHDTHDCIHQFTRRGSMKITEFTKKIKKLKDDVYKLSKDTDKFMDSVKEQHLGRPCRYATSSDFVGRHKRLAELQELVHDLPGCWQEEPKVISIVGFAGSGKTFLAKEFYESTEVGVKFKNRTWVTDAGSHAEVAKNILMGIDKRGNHAEDALDLQRLCDSLRNYLETSTHQYLIVIDDMKRWNMWNDIKYAFKDVKGLVLVTTTIQEVANTCSQGINSYVYRLSPLDREESLELFKRDWGHKGDFGHAEKILKKCDGLPLAIVDVAHYLQRQGELTSTRCNDACSNLGALLVKVDDCELERMQWVLMNTYTSLPGAIRSCLLYFCMYKRNMDALPKRSSLMWRWQAEGFVDRKTGCKYLNTLINHNIIESMEVQTDGITKRCRPHGMMAEYISKISKFEKFAALVSDPVEMPNNDVRRLSFEAGSAADDGKFSKMDLSIVLTLAVSGKGCKAILNFKKYELIAVLDLKECTNLEHSHVNYICKLVHLKYLSLGDSIGEIPKAIGKLIHLVTLEMSTNKTVKVYKDVLQLPKLRRLIGRFIMLGEKQDGVLYKFLEKESVLETITGFVTKDGESFPKLMLHMWKLRKVKIVCDATKENATCKKGKQADDKEDLTKAIKEFLLRGTDTFQDKQNGQSCSLSINFTNNNGKPWAPPLEFLKCPGSLCSLKLHGGWGLFKCPKQFTEISGITKLCLSHTTLEGKDILASLTNMTALEYLKLVEVILGPLTIESGTFQRLMRLCLVGDTIPEGITIQREALPHLVSLHLISQAPIFKVEEDNQVQPQVEDQISEIEDNQVQLMNIAEPNKVVGDQISEAQDNQVQLPNGCLESLREIALQCGVNHAMHAAWERAAKGHSNRPAVLLLPPNA